MNNPKLSVVISCFNEEKRLPQNFPPAYKKITELINSFELILVNDGSSDKTAEILKDLEKKYKNIKVVSYPENHGKGYGVKKGIESASGEIIGYTDADFAISVDHIPEFIKKIVDEDFDLVIAKRSRRLTGEVNILRQILGQTLTYLNNFFLNLNGITDTQCGFKFFKADAAKTLFKRLTVEKWLFDMEILALAKQKGFKVLALEVNWKEVPESKVKISRDLIPVLMDLTKIYFRFATLKISLIFIIFLGTPFFTANLATFF